MDLTQCKLTEAEWESIEVQTPLKEQQIMRMIIEGYTNLDICINRTQTMLGFLKMEQSDSMDKYLFDKYFVPRLTGVLDDEIHAIKNKTGRQKGVFTKLDANAILCLNNQKAITEKFITEVSSKKAIVLKSADKIRIQNADSLLSSLTVMKANDEIYELFLVKEIIACIGKKNTTKNEWHSHYFTLAKMQENMSKVVKLNCLVKKLVERIIKEYEVDFSIPEIIYNASKHIEQNKALLQYKNEQLYSHQKELFASIKQPEPKLVLYIAPTGTGKTLSPIGIDKKIIFVCAARHVGLALAKTAISVDKKIAFAFGASCADDVRLHYAAAKEYTKNRKSGKIQKVDNTKGEKVEIMICDIRSYIPAMHYMMAFNAKENIVMYWDEVTISMDYATHPLHNMIHTVWEKNVIPNIVFSSATVPHIDNMGGVRASFNEKFSNGQIHTIHSFDCVKSISMINNEGYTVLPHHLFDTYNELKRTIEYWNSNGTILRYFDTKEVGDLIYYLEKDHNVLKPSGLIEANFDSTKDIDMTRVKQHYMRVLLNIVPEAWPKIYKHFQKNRVQRLTAPNANASSAGVCITTRDAYTLTDGPTYFFTDDVNKIATFYVQQSNIPTTIMDDIMSKIDHNTTITSKVEELERTIEDLSDEKEEPRTDTKGKGKKAVKDTGKNPKIAPLQSQIDGLRSRIKCVKLHDLFVPNKLEHLKQWASDRVISEALFFSSNITDDIVIRIMKLHNIDNMHKILLLMGIGVFTSTDNNSMNTVPLNPAYLEIMKMLASEQKLYLIIANSDYLWGTNYQSCHAYFSKDLTMTQDKILQGMGRVGRGHVQQEYTVRFRDPAQIRTLLCPVEPEDKLEIVNMNRLFGPSEE